MLASQVAAIWNPLFILLLIPLFSYFVYPFLGKFFEVTPLNKMSLGFGVMTFSFCIVSVLQNTIDAGFYPSVGWQVLGCFFLTIAEVMISITCLEFAYTQAPQAMKSFVMAIFLLTVSLGNLLTSQVKFFLIKEDGSTRMSIGEEFWFWTIIAFITALIFFLFLGVISLLAIITLRSELMKLNILNFKVSFQS